MFGNKYSDGQKEAIKRKICNAITIKMHEINLGEYWFDCKVEDYKAKIVFGEMKPAHRIRNAFERKFNKIAETYMNEDGDWVIAILMELLYDEIFTVNDFRL